MPNDSGPNQTLARTKPVSCDTVPRDGQKVSGEPSRECVTEREFPGGRLAPSGNSMGPAVSAELLPMRNPDISTPSDVAPAAGCRAETPPGLKKANTTTMDEPHRWFIGSDDDWLLASTSPARCFPVAPVLNALMENVGQWFSRSAIPRPPDVMPVIKHRMINCTPEGGDQPPDDEWMHTTLGEAIAFLSKTWSKRDSQRALAGLELLHDARPSNGRAGRPSTPTHLGGRSNAPTLRPKRSLLVIGDGRASRLW